MAGIGFELKRLFAKKGILATMRAYGYAGMVCAGPMILGVVLLAGISFLAEFNGAARADRVLLTTMITYTLLASLTVTSVFSMITTRYVADMIFQEKKERVMPSFYGSIALMLFIGGLLYGVFLAFSGAGLFYGILNFLFFSVLIITWTQVNYLTAIKDYQSIISAFFAALGITFALAMLMILFTDIAVTTALFVAVIIGYGVMAVWYFVLLYRYFPEGVGSSMAFLKWISQYPHLTGVGFFTTVGLFGHIIIAWASPVGEQVKGLFYGAPDYDIGALLAFFSILITTVNFVTSVEVRFYPEYKNYFALFNEKGTISDIENAEKSMIGVLRDEFSYLAQKQVFTTILFVVLGSVLLPKLPFGFNDDMLGIFRILCAGYALYAIGNSAMLILLYFADNKDAFDTTLIFMLATVGFSLLCLLLPTTFYGVGFFAGSAVYCAAVFIRLEKYIAKLKYHVLAEQPLMAAETDGFFARIADRLDARALKIQRINRESRMVRQHEN